MNRKKILKRICRACLMAVMLALLLTGCGTRRGTASLPSYEENAAWGFVPADGSVRMRPVAGGEGANGGRILEENSSSILVGRGELIRAMETYQIEKGSTGALALEDINDMYAEKLTPEQREGTLVFFFEGAGENGDPQARNNAMCVVVIGGRIAYLDQCSSTIPDHPFLPWKNDHYDVPTLKSGIYSYDTVNHNGKYAALRVLGDQVVRFHSREEFYEDVSLHSSIEIHRRYEDENSPENESWANSVGCLMAGDAGTGVEDTYTKFIQAVGAISEGKGGNTRYQTNVTGLLILDRRYGEDYMKEVGYSDEALALLAGEEK